MLLSHSTLLHSDSNASIHMAYYGQPAHFYDSGSSYMPTWTAPQQHTLPAPGNDVTSTYLLQLQHELGYPSEAYQQFISVMRAYHSRIVSVQDVICRVRSILWRYPHLLERFMALLPHQLQSTEPPMAQSQTPPPPSSWRSDRIPVGSSQIYGPTVRSETQLQEESSAVISVDQARDYVAAVRKRFIQIPDTYDYFVDTLKLFQTGQMSPIEVVERIITVLSDQGDLLRSFIDYLPEDPNGVLREKVISAAVDAELRTC